MIHQLLPDIYFVGCHIVWHQRMSTKEDLKVEKWLPRWNKDEKKINRGLKLQNQFDGGWNSECKIINTKEIKKNNISMEDLTL